MKIIRQSDDRLLPSFKKIWLIMKLNFFLILFVVLQVSAGVSAQNTRLDLKMKNATIAQVFDEIERQSDVYFFYNKTQIDENKIISVDYHNKTVDEVLKAIVSELNLTYEVAGKNIIIKAPYPSENQQSGVKVKGTVKNAGGESLPGVTVLVKGTTNGTITDVDGNYSLTNVPANATLVFSFVGMKTSEVAVDGKGTINTILADETIGIEEVVAIGYGTAKKSDLSGAVASVQGTTIASRKTTQLSTALQGSVSGLMVTRDNSAPGATATIQVRGVTSIGDTSPLVIIDGVPGDLNSINPNDVEGISVLKDAASASIYGSRAAAGVILVTTKRAKNGDLGISYNAEFGFEKPTEMADYVGAVRYMQMVNELRWNDNKNIAGGEYPTYAKDVIGNYTSLHAQNPNVYPDTDWIGLVLKNSAPRQSHIVTVTAGSKFIRTKASLAYDETGGLYQDKNYKRLTARFNNDVTINKYISASLDFYAKRSISNNPSIDPIYFAKISAPVYAAVWSDGLIAEGKSGANVYGQLKEGGTKDYWYNQVGGKAQIDVNPIEGLKLSAVVSPELNYNKGKEFLKKVQYTDYDDPSTYVSTLQWGKSTSLSESRADNYHITTQFLANYTKSIASHNINAMAGYENYYLYSETTKASSDQLALTNYPYLDLGNVNYLSNSGSAYENAYRSYFGRIMYNYKNRYFLQGNIRYDGSSRFAKDYRWGSFPSFSAGWILSEENFMKGIKDLSFLKLRASWGTLGNERIGSWVNGTFYPNYYPYQSTISFGSALFYNGSNVVSSQTAAQTEYAIKDISWETTESFDIGVDANFFNNKLRFTGDYYKKITKDMLLELEIPDYMGYDNPNQNTGKMNTKGWEIELGWNDHLGKLTYSVSANLSDFKSKMGDLGGIQFLGDQVKFKGSEFNEWYGYKSLGIYQTQEDVDSSAKTSSTVRPGDIKYADISGPNGVPDGIISSTYDRVLLGGSLPRYMYGGNIQLGYKDFDFSVSFQGVGKQNVRINTMMVQPLYENWGSFQELIDGKYWSTYNTAEQNLAAKYPRLTYNNTGNNYAMSDFWMFNGAYFRLKNITLGYNLPKIMTDKILVKNVRVYGSVSDILTFNKYPKGWDPEVASSGYPITASFIFGVSVKF